MRYFRVHIEGGSVEKLDDMWSESRAKDQEQGGNLVLIYYWGQGRICIASDEVDLSLGARSRVLLTCATSDVPR